MWCDQATWVWTRKKYKLSFHFHCIYASISELHQVENPIKIEHIWGEIEILLNIYHDIFTIAQMTQPNSDVVLWFSVIRSSAFWVWAYFTGDALDPSEKTFLMKTNEMELYFGKKLKIFEIQYFDYSAKWGHINIFIMSIDSWEAGRWAMQEICSFCPISWQKETWEAGDKLRIIHSETAGGYRQWFEARSNCLLSPRS